MAQQTRREFLEQSMFAAVAAAAANGAGGMLARAAEPAAPAAGPNSVIRVAVLGLGRPKRGRGQAHLDSYLKLPQECEVVAICDPDIEHGMKSGVEVVEKKTNKRPTFYQDIRKLLEDKNIDAISIATPNHWHALAAIWGMQHDKHVYVEKPVSHNVSEGRRIVDAARKYKKICQAGTQSRASSGTQSVMKFLHEGGIGEVNVARGLCYKNRPSIGKRGEYAVPKSVDYDVWCGPAPMTTVTRPEFHYDWHWQWDWGNGDLGNQGIHQVDLCRWALNEKGLSDSVVSYGGRYGYIDAGDTANTQIAIFNYGPKSLVFEVRGLPTAKYHPAKVAETAGVGVGIVIEGSKGYAIMNNYTDGTIFDLDGKIVRQFKGAGKDSDHFLNFLQAVRKNDKSIQFADVEEGHVSSALCHLANISYRLGEKQSAEDVRKHLTGCKAKDNCVETFDRFAEHLTNGKTKVDLAKEQVQFGAQLIVDAKSERFTGPNSEAANQHLSRESRKGWEVPTSADKV